jgi:hypothetical protein
MAIEEVYSEEEIKASADGFFPIPAGFIAPYGDGTWMAFAGAKVCGGEPHKAGDYSSAEEARTAVLQMSILVLKPAEGNA